MNNKKSPVRGIVKTEKVWQKIINEGGEIFYVTSKSELDRSIYYLYRYIDGKAEKIAKGKSPLQFHKLTEYQKKSDKCY